MQRTIHPFIGSNYNSNGLNGRKILILGESSWHPGDAPADISKHTQNLANDAIGYDNGKGYWNTGRFYTRSARIFGFNARNYSQRDEFWNSVAYYNFLQVILSRPKIKPSPEQWQKGEIPFLETLDELTPDYIISFSQRMWKYLPKENEADIPNKYGIFAKKAQIGSSVVLGFKHTASFGFKWEQVKEIVEQNIK